MPTFEFTSPEGKSYIVEGPQGATKEQAFGILQAQLGQSAPVEKPAEPALKDKAVKSALGLVRSSIERKQAQGKGVLSGAADIGDTLLNALAPTKGSMFDSAVPSVGNWNRERSAGLESFNEANKDNADFQGARLFANIAGTGGAGGVIANALKFVSQSPKVVQLAEAIRSGGLTANGAKGLAGFATRTGGAATQGGTQAAMISPEDAGKGALISSLIPGGTQVSGYVGKAIGDVLDSGAKKLMQSSLKPTIEHLRSGKAATATQTLLDEGINATRGGVDKLKTRIGDLNDQVSGLIDQSGATISKQKVIEALNKTKEKFSRQVSPTSDMNSIDNVAADFTNHPMIKGDSIPVKLAQQLKQGTYSVVGKKYGQLGSAEIEAQKGLARGLKEGISEAVPEVAGLNARESKLLAALDVAERRALMDANKNPMGLAILAHNPATWAAFMADKSALFKSLAARMLNTTGKASAQMRLPNLVKESGMLGAPAVLSADP